jgi:rhamnogalacturonyl hydrolase YesR
MRQRTFITAAIMVATVSVGTAGTFINGAWSPSGCGVEPVIPVIEQDSVDAYNQSIKTINEWQKKASAYNTCVINEANADNALIAKTATKEQNKFRAAVEKIKTSTDAAKAKLDSK